MSLGAGDCDKGCNDCTGSCDIRRDYWRICRAACILSGISIIQSLVFIVACLILS